MAIAMGMKDEDRERISSKIDADRKEAVKVSAEIEDLEEEIKRNAYYRFLNSAGTVPISRI